MLMIRVIEVSSDTNIGGAGKCLLTYLKYYDKSKYEVSVILPKNSLLKPLVEELGVSVTEVEGIAEKSLDFDSVGRLRKVFKEQKPHIVHTHASMSARIAARLEGARVVYTRHSVFPPPAKISSGIGKLINGAVNNYFADKIIAVAEAAADNLTATGVSEKKITVVLNGVTGLSPISNDEKQEVRKRFGVGESKVISVVARLEDIKGHDCFIDAADMLLKAGIKAKFVIAGTGGYEKHLKDKVASMQLENDVLFTGFIKDVDKLMNITDIQCNASYGTEATSLALLEGMSLGIPAVVSDFGGNPGVIKNSENGFLFRQKNAEEMAQAIKKLCEDDELYEKMSKRALEMFQETFTAAAMTKNIEKVYESALSGKE